EILEAIEVPLPCPALRFRTYKLSKRFDSDISAVCAAFAIKLDGGVIARCRVAYGGVAATPKRAIATERALTGAPWTAATARAAPEVVAVLTAADIPGENDCGPIIHDDPILADGLVQYVGQPMFIVVAATYDAARRAARLAKVDYDVVPPVLTPQEAKRLQS